MILSTVGLPAVLRDYVDALAIAHQSCAEMTLPAVLSALSLVTRGEFEVVVDKSWNAGPSTVYQIVLAPSGERKSAVLRDVLSLVNALESEVRKEVAADRQLKSVILTKRQIDAGDQLRPWPVLYLADATSASLASYAHEQGGPFGLIADEAGGFRMLLEDAKSGPGAWSLLNHAYEGDEHSDRRVSRPSFRIERPVATVSLSMQQGSFVVKDMSTVASGFFGRCLFFVPPILQGKRNYLTDNAAAHDVLAEARAAFAETLGAIHKRAWTQFRNVSSAWATDRDKAMDTTWRKARLTLTDGKDKDKDKNDNAAGALRQFAQDIENSALSSIDFTSLARIDGWLNKFPQRTVRLAALFALVENPQTTTVDKTHIDMSIALAPFLARHAVIALRHMTNESSDLHARILALLAKKTGTTGAASLSAREVYTGLRAPASQVRTVLTQLQEQGLVSALPDKDRLNSRIDKYRITEEGLAFHDQLPD